MNIGRKDLAFQSMMSMQSAVELSARCSTKGNWLKWEWACSLLWGFSSEAKVTI